MKEKDWRLRVFDSLSFPTLVLRPDRVVLSANRVFLEKVGARIEDVAGKTCHDVFQKFSSNEGLPCSEQNCPLVSTLRSRKGHSLLRTTQDQQGNPQWEERVFSPIFDDHGEVFAVIESIRDVTELKTMERVVAGIQEFMNRVIQSSVSAIVAADCDGQILLMNQAAEELFGWGFHPGIELNIRQLYPEGKASEVMKKLRDADQGGKGKLPLTRMDIVNARGETIPVEMTAAIIYEGTSEVATMGIFHDLREKLAVEGKLKEAQTQLVQSEKMASLGRLAAGVAHEINNPLTGILLYGSMLMEGLADDDAKREKLTCMLEDATRCRDIVKDLLAYSRQTSSSKQVIDMNDLVTDSLLLIRDQKLFLNVTLLKDLSAERLLFSGDGKQLSQVIINLVMNALDAMDGKGTLTLRTFRLEDPHRVCLEVIDTGSGIPSEFLSHVFDPFFTTKEPGKGTGLGLSTAYGIVKENAGEISIKETGAGGTTILLTLPGTQGEDQQRFGLIG
jgi:two-component system NtrC family sensor kinase